MSTSGYERYLSAMADFSAEVMGPYVRDKELRDKMPESEKKLLDDVFKRFTEVDESINNLEMSLEFMQSRMPRRKGIRPDKYLNYHLTFYIQEIYVLRERMVSYAKVLMRLVKRRAGGKSAEQRFENLIEAVNATLDPLIKLRGDHVHNRIFSDDSLTMLSSLSVIASVKPEFSEDLALEYSFAKKGLVKKIEKNRVHIKKMVDLYFEFLLGELSGGSNPVLPNHSFKADVPDGPRP